MRACHACDPGSNPGQGVYHRVKSPTTPSFVPAPANATLNQTTAVVGSNLTAGINTTQNLVRAGVNSIAGMGNWANKNII